MKTNSFLKISFFLLSFAYANLYAQNQVLIKSIEYDVPIINNELCQGSEMSGTEWWKRNIEASGRLFFQHALLSKALNGQIKVYNESGNELGVSAITKLVSYTDTLRIARSVPPYDYYDTILTRYTSPSEIIGIRFRETWYYNPETFQISKEISSYSPLTAVEKTIKYQNKYRTISEDKPLFWIKCNPQSNTNKFSTLTDYIQYNCPVYYNMQVVMPQFGYLEDVSTDTTSRREYMKTLINSVLDLKTKAYFSSDFSDYYSFAIDTIIPLSETDFINIIGSDTIMMAKPFPPYDEYDTIIYKNIELQNLSIYRFHEKWMLDTKTMELKKDVIALSPCEEVKNSKGEFKGVRPLFTIHFEKLYRCFAE